jgi:putative oxidoreductase
MDRVTKLVEKAVSVARKADWAVLLVARLTVGVLFVSTGWGKVHNLVKVTAYFGDELHIPMPHFNAVLASYTELVCGSLLVVGIASRFVAIPLIITMAVALLTAKAPEIHGLADLFGEIEWTYLAILLVIVALGPGVASVDGAVKWLRLRPGHSATTGAAR